MHEGATPEPTEPIASVKLTVQLDSRINYALQQNDVPVVKEIHIENLSATPIKDLRLEVRAEPQFASTWVQHLEVQIGRAHV